MKYSRLEVRVVVCNALLDLFIGELCFGNNVECDRKCVELIVESEDLFEECLLVLRFLEFWQARESISNNVALAGKINNIGTIFLNNQSPASDAIGREI